ncbi:MAG TPA: hypothetical protein VJZ71_13140 [Phycisphaerae bacterium]|nr:hypothetical protein [Phycisphaerae bacterium]
MCETTARQIRKSRSTRWLRPMSLSFLLFLVLGVTLGGFVCETEPNDNMGQSNFIRHNELASGGITPNGDGDFYRREGAAAGDLIFAYVDTSGSTTSIDSFLRILGHDGSLIEEDNDSGPPGAALDSSSAIAGAAVSPAQAGNVFYQVFEVGDDDTISSYSLFQAVVNPAATAAETEANNSSGTADFISAAVMSGTLGGTPDFFEFTASQDAVVAVIVDDNPDDDGDFTDTDLHILDTDGTTVLGGAAGEGDNFDTDDANAAGSVTLPADGTYYVRIQDDGTTADSEYRFVLLVNGVVYVDADMDGASDTDDNCPGLANGAQTDSDGDGVGNACETCDFGILKTAPGVCGCAEPDVDHQGNGTIDCGLADPALALLSRVGLLLVADATSNRVMAFDPEDGDLVDPDFIPSDPVNLPSPVAAILGPNQNIVLVSDSTADVVQAYDFDGNYLGVFAPAGGANLAIMDSPFGMAIRPNGNLVVCVTAGANANAVAEFDSGGNHVGNFIAPGAGGLSSPQDIIFRANGTALVSGSGNGAIHAYDSAGASLGDFADINGTPLQLLGASDGAVLSAVTFGDLRGIVTHSSAGAFVSRHAPTELLGFQGLAELGNGNLLITTPARTTTGNLPGGAFEMTRAGVLVGTQIAGYNLRYVEFVIIDHDGDGVGDDLDTCPADPNKSAPGQCGCGTPDTDGDGDGTADCNDDCPADPGKTAPGVCGCGVSDADANGNGTADCLDPPPPVPPGPQPTPGCCAPGVFPTVGLFMPMLLLGWKWTRSRR